MVAAMELATQEGVDVFNISIGAAFQWPNYPTAKAADAMARKGVVVVTSAGNSGANGLYSLGAPSVGEKVISVASYNNTALKIPSFLASPDGLQVGYQQATGSPAAPTTGSFPLARTGTATSTADGCNTTPLAAGSLTGKIALIRRGTCGFHEKALNAQNAGAAGVIIYNNTTGLQNITVEGVPAIVIPTVSITAADGVTLNNRIAAGATTLTWSDLMFPFPIATANTIAGSSSTGLSPNLTLKPDLGAPGAGIYSTDPLEQGGYANLSGTSMSSPHVAGAAALLLQARPNTPPQAVLALLQNSASPRLWSGNPALGLLEVVHRQGAGMIQLANAINSTAKVEPAKLSLGESEAGPAVRTLTIENKSAQDVTYTLSHAPALATGPNTFVPAYFAGYATAAFSAPTVTVPANGTANFTVTITPNTGLQDGSLYGGYVVLTPQGDSPALRVPYAGFKGDYQSIQVLKPTTSNFPWLAKLNGTSLVNQPAGATYTMAGTDLPRMLVHFDHQLRSFRVDVFDADTGKAWHTALQQDWVGRNSGATSFFTLTWDGSTRNGNKVQTVPNGRYILKLSVVQAYGDASNPAHVETWTSPVVTIAR
jgi:minor extracellular serine protease Vpr